MIDPLQSLVGKFDIQTVLLFRVAKSASSSLYSAVGDRNLFRREQKLLDKHLLNTPMYRGLFSSSHLTPSESFRIFGRGILNYFSFCCVRNSFERILSMYSFSNGKDFGNYYGLKNEGTFEEFVNILYEKFQNGEQNFMGIRPQTAWTHDPAFKPRVILRFSHLNQDWQKMLRDYDLKGFPETLPHANRSNHDDWKSYYNDDLRKKVAKIFEQELDLLGFSDKIPK